jgi:hypothetical protein
MLATGTLMVLGGIAAALVAAARGLGLVEAFHLYLWTGLLFAGAFVALMALVAIPLWAWRRARGSRRRVVEDLPEACAVATGWGAWVEAARGARFNAAFLTCVALAQPRLGAGLGGFSVLGILLLPFWAYRRLQPGDADTFIVRGRRGWQRRTYRRRSRTG